MPESHARVADSKVKVDGNPVDVRLRTFPQASGLGRTRAHMKGNGKKASPTGKVNPAPYTLYCFLKCDFWNPSRLTRCWYAGIRKTALGNEFEGIFDKGRPFEGVWTTPNKIKTPYLAAAENFGLKQSATKTTPPPSRSKSDPYLIFALEMVCSISASGFPLCKP